MLYGYISDFWHVCNDLKCKCMHAESILTDHVNQGLEVSAHAQQSRVQQHVSVLVQGLGIQLDLLTHIANSRQYGPGRVWGDERWQLAQPQRRSGWKGRWSCAHNSSHTQWQWQWHDAAQRPRQPQCSARAAAPYACSQRQAPKTTWYLLKLVCCPAALFSNILSRHTMLFPQVYIHVHKLNNIFEGKGAWLCWCSPCF
jgi:hypothetical protein